MHANPIIRAVCCVVAHPPGSCMLCQSPKMMVPSAPHVYVVVEDYLRGLDQGDQTPRWIVFLNLGQNVEKDGLITVHEIPVDSLK